MYDNKKNNAKEDKQTPEEKASESINAKKKQDLEEFFNKLHTMANSVEDTEDMPQGPAPRTRSERAAAFSAQVKKNMGK